MKNYSTILHICMFFVNFLSLIKLSFTQRYFFFFFFLLHGSVAIIHPSLQRPVFICAIMMWRPQQGQFARSAQTPIIATTQILTHRTPHFSIIKWKIILLNGSIWKINKLRPPAKWNKDFCLFVHFYLHRVSGAACLHSHANALRWNP